MTLTADRPGRGLAPAMIFWLLILTALASFRERHGSELFQTDGIDEQVKFQAAAWCGLGLAALYLLWSGRADLRLLRGGPLLWYAGFIAVAALSAVVSPVPLLTLFRAAQHGIALVLVISLRDYLRRLYAFVLVYVAINWVLLLLALTGLDFGQEWISRYVRDYQLLGGNVMERWRFESAFGHASWLSIIAAIGAVGLAARTQGRDWRRYGPIIAWLALTVLLTVSRTAILSLAVGLVVVLFLRRSLPAWLLLVPLPIALLLASGDVRQAAEQFLMRGQTSGEFASLTGRDGLYRVSLERIERSLPWGEGFQSGRFNPLEEDKASMAHAHNLFLEAITGAGILGGLCVVAVLASWFSTLARLWLRSRRAENQALAGELLAISAPLLAFCLLDSGFAVAVHHVTFAYLSVMARAQTAVLEERAMAVAPTASIPLRPLAAAS